MCQKNEIPRPSRLQLNRLQQQHQKQQQQQPQENKRQEPRVTSILDDFDCSSEIQRFEGFYIGCGDIGGRDIYQVEGNHRHDISYLAKLCKQDIQCAAFNSEGWLKLEAPNERNFQASATLKLFSKSKIPAVASSAAAVVGDAGSKCHKPTLAFNDAYWEVPCFDIDGYDIGSQMSNVGFSELARVCSANAGCIGFNFNGWLKLATKDALRSLAPTTETSIYLKKQGGAVSKAITAKDLVAIYRTGSFLDVRI